ncbi:AAA family ATPase [Desulfonema ishimotonii]|uniref:Replication-associated recombination protein A n=1 Tax=Desulfonema ishimotonii TaxID=45657 RepID=A0A401G1Y3_9BACT|nr:replication-associated recombination protein A [Desulfonema ishimotonii]GBC63206.1 AAA family ATPase [Desulfonema ishimotonii]
MDLFDYQAEKETEADRPLAERMRPVTLDDFMGQGHAVGQGSLIRHAVENDRIFSMILWGPPGCGKTTLAGILAAESRSHFIHFSAVLSGVREIRAVIEEAKKRRIYGKKTVVFVDEIHRFNKSQQDAFLHHVESGLITLIGATTENPSFEVIAPLLSRCRVITLQALSEDALARILDRALADRENGLGVFRLTLTADARSHLVRIADGDARSGLNSLEIAAHLSLAKGSREICLSHVESALQKESFRYDKSGEEHYNLISAFHKSLRGSDPDAAIYWLARMLEAGEDPMYAARRMVRFASEDVGNADPYGLRVALDAVESYRFLGSPEGDMALAQAAVYLATAPKSNSVYTAYNTACDVARKTGSLPVPFHIRNAPTRLMKEQGYKEGYKYAHDYKDAYIPQEYLPDQLRGHLWYFPSDRGYEQTVRGWVEHWRRLKAGWRTKK